MAERTGSRDHITGMTEGDLSARMIISRIDSRLIYCRQEDGEGGETAVCIDGNRCYPYDWSYLRDTLRPGVMLSLIHPSEGLSEGVRCLCPELIIAEPDYLVDITSVASCFQHYGETALTDIINKIKAPPSSAAIALGNFAGQLLDEEVHRLRRPYAESARLFFHRQMFSLLTTSINVDFHRQARLQQDHIRAAIAEVERLESLSREDMILEASFISPMLGLQGRVDLLSMDLRLLIEQKSGKSCWPQPPEKGGAAPRPVLSHYVQMLLYTLLIRCNYHERYKENGNRLDAFLLYSKYANSLCRMDIDRGLIFRAISLRNAIACQCADPSLWTERLASLSADTLNVAKVSGALWSGYTRRDVERLLAPLHVADSLERAYYLRMMRFVAAEHLTAKTGGKGRRSPCRADMWRRTTAEKEREGTIIASTRIGQLSPAEGEKSGVGRVELLFFSASRVAEGAANFRPGDIVAIYPCLADGAANAARSVLLRGTLETIDEGRAVIRLRAAQGDDRLFRRYGSRRWAMEHDFMESSYVALYRGVHLFLSAPKERRDLLLLRRRPRVDTSRRLLGDYGRFNDMALSIKQAVDLFLLIGPPGTGKTSFGMVYALKEQLLEPSGNILLLSYTNRAVREMCSKLEDEGIDYIRLGAGAARGGSLGPRLEASGNIDEARSIIDEARVVAATTAAMNANIALFGGKTFALAIVDEASQILEPHLLGILSVEGAGGGAAIAKVVLIGDHKQLPAVVQQSAEESRVEEGALHAIGLTDCRRSLFERLLGRYRGDRTVTYTLTRQGRMHPAVADLPNRLFYGGRLVSAGLSHQREDDDGARSLFFNVAATRRGPYDNDKVNSAEAAFIARLAEATYEREREAFDADTSIGVIVPYRNQIAEVRALLPPVLRGITVDTVERFQGSQRDTIIFGFTVSSARQLSFLTDGCTEEEGMIINRKLNVALTRARRRRYLVGDADVLGRDALLKRVIDYFRSRGAFFTVGRGQ